MLRRERSASQPHATGSCSVLVNIAAVVTLPHPTHLPRAGITVYYIMNESGTHAWIFNVNKAVLYQSLDVFRLGIARVLWTS